MNKKIWFEKELLRSPAFRSLNKWSMLVYFDFLRKRQMEPVKQAKRSDEWIIKNNGEIVYPYSEAEHKGIGRREFRNAIDELMEKGFLDIAHLGSGGRAGDMTMYFIDNRWKNYGTSSFRPAKNLRKKDTRQGRGWTAFHAKKKKTPVTKLVPKKVLSSGSSVTPDVESQIFSSNGFDTPKAKRNNATSSTVGKNDQTIPLPFWSNIFDTIL